MDSACCKAFGSYCPVFFNYACCTVEQYALFLTCFRSLNYTLNCKRSLQHSIMTKVCVHIGHILYMLIYYIPGTQMTLALIGKGLLWEGSTPKTKDKQVPGIYIDTNI